MNVTLKKWKVIGIAYTLVDYVTGTSIKTDFLPSGHVRTDPIVTQTCLSDHIHTFYGANVLPYPSLTYNELRSVGKNDITGNIEENKSIYWHPTVYKYDPTKDTYYRDEIAQSSAYYIWETGEAKAFPNGFRMIAGTKGTKDGEYPNAIAECVGESKCERKDSCDTENDFFPEKACYELEVSMFFPGCWDGVNLDSEDHMSHVAYTIDGELDGECPDTHPVKIPIISLFFRIFEYSGGWHTFSDGTGIYHADFISGWDENFLQGVLDNCENDSFGPNPNAFCDDFVTFRDAPKCSDDDCDFADPNLLKKLKNIQPKLNDFKKISPEETKEIKGDLPRGECTGTLLPRDGSPVSPPVPSPVTPPTPSPTAGDSGDGSGDNTCEDDENYKYKGKKGKTCHWINKKDKRAKNLCKKNSVKDACPETCGMCQDDTADDSDCTDNKEFEFKVKGKNRNCKWVAKKKKKTMKKYCRNGKVKVDCAKTCGQCSD